MAAVVVLVIILVVALLAGVHWYVWRRLVRDTTARGTAARRIGTAAVWVLPLLSFAALASGRSGAPFWLERILAWPGYLWLAVLLYLVLALVVGEAVRPLLLRVLERRAAGADHPNETAAPSTPPASATVPVRPEGPAASANDTPVPAGTAASPEAAAPGESARPAGAAVAVDAAPPTGQAAGPEEGTAAAGDAPRTGDAPGAAAGAQDVAAPDRARPAGAAVSRRLFVSRIVGGAAAAAALGTVGHGTYGVLGGPRVKRVTVPLAKLPRAAHGFRVAVVSDIHLGPILGRAHTQRIVDSINATQPDLVAVVGDLVDGSVADLGPAAEPLAQLRSRHGSFFVTGNHEYFSGADEWVDHVRELGLRPLRNERVEMAGGFDLAGVDDVAGEDEGQGPDFVRALGDRDRSRAAVLLAHQPVVIHDAVEHGVDLQLSGHTHGGQLWPGNLLAGLANPTVAGLERYGDTQLYVSRGAGAWGPPVRVGAPSDITVVELASRQA
ncbi:metallophosphoesterase [Streptomyces peucetius]|uniref:Metallophosphoesterase n=1 Tax=Streptomyces peucetius TaxID=1950 RepID=A0ABY6IAI1_STRPE|nr:metallophosphoesterase [Streptomyces peucetius]UYQ63968.1 metallophosphoesterase [Streptomyces peucetius]